MDFTDYHIHTLYSNHGIGTVAEVAASAAAKGLIALGFSEHFPLPKTMQPAAPESWNMRWDQIEQYIADVRAVQEQYAGRMKILLGFEIDYLPEYDADMRTNLAHYHRDYSVGSVHIVDRYHSDHQHWSIDSTPKITEEGIHEKGGVEGVYARYYELVRDYARSHAHTIVGHLDLIKKFNRDGRFFDQTTAEYLGHAEATLDVLKATGKIIEVSTAGLYKDVGEIYPSDPILQMILERRIPICLSSDAHNPDHVARDFGPTWRKLVGMGFEQITYL